MTTLSVPNQTHHSKGPRQTSSESTQEAQHEFYADARNGFQFFKKPFQGKRYRTYQIIQLLSKYYVLQSKAKVVSSLSGTFSCHCTCKYVLKNSKGEIKIKNEKFFSNLDISPMLCV